MKQRRVLPADVFDALELSVLVHGGVGAGCLTTLAVDGERRPCCIIGQGMFLDGYSLAGGGTEENIDPGDSPVCDALAQLFPDLAPAIQAEKNWFRDLSHETYNQLIGITECENDREVRALKPGDGDATRITWKQWCRRLNVVRGE